MVVGSSEDCTLVGVAGSVEDAVAVVAESVSVRYLMLSVRVETDQQWSTHVCDIFSRELRDGSCDNGGGRPGTAGIHQSRVGRGS